MLQAIRDKVTGWIAYGIIFLISIPFALWGVNSYLGGGEVLPAATVDGEEITLRQLDQAYANYRQRMSQLFGGTIPEAFGNESMLREQVLNQLVEEVVLRQYIQKQRYRIGNDELNKMIRDMDAFQRDGQFDTDIYQAQLRSLGYSPVGFEQELRVNGSMEQFQNGILETAFVVPVFKDRFTQLGNQTRKIRSLTYTVNTNTIQVDDAEIEQHYQTQANRYRIPEKVKVDYIELSLDSIKANIEVRADDVLARYQENQAAYTSAEFREASHILIKVTEDESSEQALARITEIRQRIVNGEEFSDLAKALSEDPGSADSGGDLGEIERGVMVQPFEAALFSMQVDQLSEPVKTAFGWHLIKLHSISGGETQSFESLKAGLEDEIKTELAETQIYDLVESLANLAYEQPDSLLPAAEQLDLPVQTSGWFDRSAGEGIAAEPKVRQVAFSPEVLAQGLNSEAIELGSDRVVFLRLHQREPSAPQPLEQVRERIKTELVRIKSREQSLKAGTDALAELEGGKSLDDLAREWSSTISDLGFIERNQSGIEAALLKRAFSMRKPDQGKVYDGLSKASGEYVMLELSAVVSSAKATDNEALKSLDEGLGNLEYQAIIKLLTTQADITRTPSEDLEDLQI